MLNTLCVYSISIHSCFIALEVARIERSAFVVYMLGNVVV